MVVDRNPAQHQNQLASLHEEFFGPGKSDPLAPVQFEVIDRATDEAIQRLMAAGLLAKTTRGTRALFPLADAGVPPPLSEQERKQVAMHREQGKHSLGLARVLGAANFPNETRANLLTAGLHLARAWAAENRLPEPASLEDALLPPLSHCWKESLAEARSFLAEPTHPWQALLEKLERA